jgi:hypothetical protein
MLKEPGEAGRSKVNGRNKIKESHDRKTNKQRKR